MVSIDENKANLKTENQGKMLVLFNENQTSQTMIETVPQELVSNYGIIYLQGQCIESGERKSMEAIVEKLNQDRPPSNLAVIGCDVLCGKIWSLLKHTAHGAGMRLTNAVSILIQRVQTAAY